MVLPLPDGASQSLTPAAIAHFAIAAGVSGDDVWRAVAVAMAESSGNTGAIGGLNANGSRDYGLWQINDRAHPDLLTADTQWWSPPLNAAMMFQVYKGAGFKWTPWSVFNSGKYLLFATEAKTAAQFPDASLSQGFAEPQNNGLDLFAPISAISEAFKSIGGAIFKASAWMSNQQNWVRVAYTGLGTALIVGALIVVAKPYVTTAAKGAAKVATTVIPAGKAAKVAGAAGAVKGSK